MTAQKSQKAQKGQKGRKTNFKSRRRGRRAATPARLLPALRQTCPPRLRGFTMLSRRGTGTDRPPPVVLPWDVVQAVDALRPSAPLCGLFCPLWLSIAPHGLRPSWVALRGCEGIQLNRHKRTPEGCLNLSGVSCAITNASGGGCGASSNLQAVAPLRGCTWVYYTVVSLLGSYNSPVRNVVGFRTLASLKCYGCLVCCGF